MGIRAGKGGGVGVPETSAGYLPLWPLFQSGYVCYRTLLMMPDGNCDSVE